MHFNACRCASSSHRHVGFSFTTTLSLQNVRNNSLRVHDLINERLKCIVVVECGVNYFATNLYNFFKYVVAEGARAVLLNPC